MVHSHSNLLACASICRSLVWTTTSVRLVPCKVKKGGHVEWFVQVWWTITQCGLRIVLSPDPTPSYYWSRSGNVSWHLKVVWNVPVREQVTKWLLSRSWAEPVARHSSWRLLENVVQLNKSRMLLNISDALLWVPRIWTPNPRRPLVAGNETNLLTGVSG